MKIPPGVYREILDRFKPDGIPAARVGMREFRQNIQKYIDAEYPFIIFRHSYLVGMYVPFRVKNQRTLEDLEHEQSLLQDKPTNQPAHFVLVPTYCPICEREVFAISIRNEKAVKRALATGGYIEVMHTPEGSGPHRWKLDTEPTTNLRRMMSDDDRR